MIRVPVRPALIDWALDRAGLSVGHLSGRFPKIEQWRRGEVRPTLKQLESFARATWAPVGYFFLDSPPVERMPIPDFRTMPDPGVRTPSADLLDTIYLCQQRQAWYHEFARTVGEGPRPYVGSARVTSGIEATAAEIRTTLGFSLEERRSIPTWSEALRRFIEQADTTGVLVMCSGVVRNDNRRKLNPDEFRGFALSDDLAPVLFINGADTRAAQMFTLAHELAHLWLGQSAVSDAQAVRTPDHEVERWCDRVAAELLVPLDAIRDHVATPSGPASLRSELDRLARRFKVSTLVILRRMHDAGALSRERMWEEYEVESRRLRDRKKPSGGNFYLTLGARASRRFARALVISTLEGQTSFSEALRLLGVKRMKTFEDLQESLGVGG